MSELYGDAFKDDKREERLYGDDITDEKSTFLYDPSKELPASKSNNVSFMKVEDLPLECRNILAVSETHICYSVTQKKNLLRIIDTQVGEKVILRGHENAVLDLRFAIAENGLLCSVDNGEVSGKAHTIVWKKNEQQGDWKVHAELPLSAILVRPHPVRADLWLVAGPTALGIFSATANASLASAAQSFQALPHNLVLDQGESIVDVAFSSSGKHIAVAVQRAQESASVSHIRMFKVTDGQGLQKVVASNPLAVFSCHNLLALQWTRNHIITASAEDTSASSESVVYQVTLWSTEVEARDTGRTAPTPTAAQTVTVHLPRSAAGTASSGLLNARLECALSLEPRAERYLLLTSRRSNLVACLALNPAYAGVGQPLYHITCLNLRAPVISADVVTVLGQAHHSAEAGEHLEVSAYQEAASEAGQASIQQYHVLFAQLFSLSAYHALPEIRAQQQGPENGASDVATAGMMIPLATLLEGSPTKQRIAENNNITAAMEASNTKGMTILNILNNMQRSTSSGSLSNSSSSQAPAPAPVAPAVLPSPGIVRPQPVPQPSPSAAAATNKLLDLLSGGSSAKKSPVEVKETKISGSEGLPAFLLATQPAKNSSILDVLKPKPVTPVPTAPVVAPSTPSAVRPATTATLTPTAPAAPAVPVTATAKLVVPTPTRPAAVAAAPASTSAKPLPTSAVTTTSANGSTSDKQIEQLTAAMRDLQASVAALSSAQQQTQSQSQIMSEQQGQQSVKQLQQAVRDLQAGQNKQSEQLLAAVRKAMEGEAKRANDQNTASTGTMRNEVSEQILKELVPAIANKVRDSVRDTVRDSLRAQLPVAFRESFESGLLPAFEAGAQAMFQQLQGAFVHGMQGVMQEGLRVQSINAATKEQLQQEVRELRETVSRLEGSVLALSSTVQSLTESLVAGTLSQQSLGQQNSQQEDVSPAQDAFTLLAEGRVSDAIVRVLEDKDITVTVRLLELLTPSQVAACCSHLEILCITQQLAADMSVNIPIEGIGKRVDWIKNLVLSLFSSKNSSSSIYEDPNYDTHFKTMITVVLESISAAKRLVFSAQYDTGEDDALSSLQVPQSVGTDLQLLEYVIQSKM